MGHLTATMSFSAVNTRSTTADPAEMASSAIAISKQKKEISCQMCELFNTLFLCLRLRSSKPTHVSLAISLYCGLCGAHSLTQIHTGDKLHLASSLVLTVILFQFNEKEIVDITCYSILLLL